MNYETARILGEAERGRLVRANPVTPDLRTSRARSLHPVVLVLFLSQTIRVKQPFAP